MTAIRAKEINPTNITIEWDELADEALNGRDLPIFYSLEYKSNATGSDWVELNAG